MPNSNTVIMLAIAVLTSTQAVNADSPEPDKEVLKIVRKALIGSTWLKESDEKLFKFDGMATISNFLGKRGTWKVIGQRAIVAQMEGFYAITFDIAFQHGALFGKDGLTMKIHRKKEVER